MNPLQTAGGKEHRFYVEILTDITIRTQNVKTYNMTTQKPKMIRDTDPPKYLCKYLVMVISV